MRNFYVLLTIAACCLTLQTQAQGKTDPELLHLLREAAHPVVRRIIADPLQYRCQIIYTRINRNEKGEPSFQHSYFNYDPKLYFNPASVVKMPLAFLSLEKLNNLKIPGVNKYTSLLIDSSYPGQMIAHKDSTSANGLPGIAHYIKRALLISENDPYNRMYQFLGQGTINRLLHQKGYPNAVISRQFMGYSEEQNRHTNPFRFINAKGRVIYQQPAAYNRDSLRFEQVIKIGKAYMNRNDSIIPEPFDFTRHNNISLGDFQQLLQSVLFPQSVPAQQRFNLTGSDRNFLLKYLSQYPSETDDPKYNDSVFYDSYVKFFFRDSTRKMPAHVRVFNKVGWAYGFLTDVSYVVDTHNNIEYMLAATVYVNSDEVVNDGKYDYETTGWPFLRELGKIIYQHELTRQRKYQPKLNGFGIRYDQRNKKDTRPVITTVDN
ncbi:MAG TPA: serine hydrolase [Sediminibacterium sp.]|nr:serine hydrolase [Sediminibacterium sp.]